MKEIFFFCLQTDTGTEKGKNQHNEQIKVCRSLNKLIKLLKVDLVRLRVISGQSTL